MFGLIAIMLGMLRMSVDDVSRSTRSLFGHSHVAMVIGKLAPKHARTNEALKGAIKRVVISAGENEDAILETRGQGQICAECEFPPSENIRSDPCAPQICSDD